MHAELTYLGVSIIVVRNGKIRGTKTHLIKQAHLKISRMFIKVPLLIFMITRRIFQRRFYALTLENNKLLEDMFAQNIKK